MFFNKKLVIFLVFLTLISLVSCASSNKTVEEWLNDGFYIYTEQLLRNIEEK